MVSTRSGRKTSPTALVGNGSINRHRNRKVPEDVGPLPKAEAVEPQSAVVDLTDDSDDESVGFHERHLVTWEAPERRKIHWSVRNDDVWRGNGDEEDPIVIE